MIVVDILPRPSPELLYMFYLIPAIQILGNHSPFTLIALNLTKF